MSFQVAVPYKLFPFLLQILADLRQRRRLRIETASLIQQAERVLLQLHETAGEATPTAAVQPDTQDETTTTTTLFEQTSTETAQQDSNQEQQGSTAAVTSSSSSSPQQQQQSSLSVVLPLDPDFSPAPVSQTEFPTPSAPNFVVFSSTPIEPASRFEAWILPRPFLRWIIKKLDWWIRWLYQLVFALVLSLYPSWQPLTALVSERPIMPSLISSEAVSVLSVGSEGLSSSTAAGLRMTVLPPGMEEQQRGTGNEVPSSSSDSRGGNNVEGGESSEIVEDGGGGVLLEDGGEVVQSEPGQLQQQQQSQRRVHFRENDPERVEKQA